MNASPAAAPSEQMLRRIRSEYVEMPGLQLTPQQAQRLWGLDEDSCLTALECLVEAKFLCKAGGMYLRYTESPIAGRQLRMAGAWLNRNADAVHVGLRGGWSL